MRIRLHCTHLLLPILSLPILALELSPLDADRREDQGALTFTLHRSAEDLGPATYQFRIMGSLPAREFADSLPRERYIDSLDDIDGLREHARVRAWGRNDIGQCDIPEDLGRIRDLALGTRSTAILLDSGRIVSYGSPATSPFAPGHSEAYHLEDGEALLINARYRDHFGHHPEAWPYDMIVSTQGRLPPDITPEGDFLTGSPGNVSRLYPRNGTRTPFSSSASHLLYIDGGAGSYDVLALPYSLSTYTPPRNPLPAQSIPYGRFSARLSAGPDHGIILVDQTAIAYVYAAPHHKVVTRPPPDHTPYEHGIMVPNLREAAAGFHHCVAIRTDDSVVAWGSNGSGQCDVPGLDGIPLDVAASSNHSALLYQDGRLLFWGDITLGQGFIGEDTSGVVALRTAPYHSAVYEHYKHGEVSFPSGATDALITITPSSDAIPEPHETFRLVIVDPGTSRPLAQAHGRIRDDDTPRTAPEEFRFHSFRAGTSTITFEFRLPRGTPLPADWESSYQAQWSEDLRQWIPLPVRSLPGDQLLHGNNADNTGYLVLVGTHDSATQRFFRILALP